MLWRFLLQYGAYSGGLSWHVRLANGTVDWADIKALMVNQLIAPDKYDPLELLNSAL